MGFTKKQWVDRQSEYPTRRRLTPVTGETNVYDVGREEGVVSEEGNAFDAQTMNDLEDRIEKSINEVGTKTISANGVTSGSAAELTLEADGFSLKDGALVLARVHIAIPLGTSITLNVNGTGAKPVFTEDYSRALPKINLGSYIVLIYSSACNGYITQLSNTVPRAESAAKADTVTTVEKMGVSVTASWGSFKYPTGYSASNCFVAAAFVGTTQVSFNADMATPVVNGFSVNSSNTIAAARVDKVILQKY